jgi:aspartate racemase
VSKHIGIVACSAEGAALCYRTICNEAPERMGEDRHPEITMHNHCLGEYMEFIRAGDWRGVADLMLSSARKVAGAGADFAISPDNTIHEAYEMVEANSPIPWLHIARVVGKEARGRGFGTLGILGTCYLMTGPVYPGQLGRMGIDTVIPGQDDRERIDEIIFTQLVKAEFPEESRLFFNEVMERLKARGADAAVLGCTEIPLLVRPDDAPLPTLDSTRLLARAAIGEALA